MPRWAAPVLAIATVLLGALSLTAVAVVGPRARAEGADTPRPGLYHYRATSTVTSGTAPSTTTERTERAYALQYEPLAGVAGEQRMRRRSEQSGHQDKAWRSDGIYDLADVFLGRTRLTTCQWRPPKLALPLPLRAGDRRKGDSRCELVNDSVTRRTSVTTQFHVKHRRQATVAGRRLAVYEIDSQSSTAEVISNAGVVTARILRKENETFVFAPAIGVVVESRQRAHARSEDVRGNVLELRSETRSVLDRIELA